MPFTELERPQRTDHTSTNVSKDGPKKIVALLSLGLEIGDRKPRYGCMLPERAKKFGKT